MRGSLRPPNAGKGRPKGAKNKGNAEVRALAQRFTAQVRSLDVELSRLAAAVAAGGDFAALLEAIRDREQKRTALLQRLEALNGLRQASAFDVRHVERELRARLTDWRGLLGRHHRSPARCS